MMKMAKGTTASRAVLVIIGAMMAISAISAGIQPLNSLLGISDRSTEFDSLEELSEDVRRSCTEARNSESLNERSFESEFDNLNKLTVSDDGKALKAFFSGEKDWKSEDYRCQLSLEIEGEEDISEGEWRFKISSPGGENPEVNIQAMKQ